MNKPFATVSFSNTTDRDKPLFAIEVSDEKEVGAPGPVLPKFEYETTYSFVREDADGVVCMIQTSFYLNGVLVGTTTSYKYL